jgi:hypothetical protein
VLASPRDAPPYLDRSGNSDEEARKVNASRSASLAFGLALALVALKLAGCSLNPTPPNPHDHGNVPEGGEALDESDPPGVFEPDAGEDAADEGSP